MLRKGIPLGKLDLQKHCEKKERLSNIRQNVTEQRAAESSEKRQQRPNKDSQNKKNAFMKSSKTQAHRQKNFAEVNDFISQFAGESVVQSQDNFFQYNTSQCSFLSTPFPFPPFDCRTHFNNLRLLQVIIL